MNLEDIKAVEVGGLPIAYRISGPPDGRPVVLVTGFGDQLIEWPNSLIGALEADGWRVIAYEPRDSGLSGDDPVWRRFDVPDLMAVAAGSLGPVYTLDDLADELLGLCEALELDEPHLIGYSMGGMITQRAALRARFASLTLLFSSSGAPGLTQSGPDVLQASVAITQPANAEARLAASLRLIAITNGSQYAKGEAEASREIAALQQRAYRPDGAGRMMAALLGSAPVYPRLGELTLPSLIIAAAEDCFFGADHADDLSARITGSQLQTIVGAGHNLPEPLGDVIASLWLNFAHGLTDEASDAEPA